MMHAGAGCRGAAATVACALACFAIAAGATSAAAQQIRGTVLESENREPVASAMVLLLDGEGARLLQVETDSAGFFSLPLPRVGTYALRVEKLGYETLDTESFQVQNREILELRIFVGVEAVPLAPVEVTARRREMPRAHPDFYRRTEWGKKSGFGHFFTREDIEKTALLKTSSLLMQVPSLRLVHGRDGNVTLGVSDRGGLNCRAAVYMNGMEVNHSWGLDWLATLDELEGIEVYRFRSEVPAELATHGVCTAVAFWTRVRRSNRAWNWGRAAALGVAVFSGLALYQLFLR